SARRPPAPRWAAKSRPRAGGPSPRRPGSSSWAPGSRPAPSPLRRRLRPHRRYRTCTLLVAVLPPPAVEVIPPMVVAAPTLVVLWFHLDVSAFHQTSCVIVNPEFGMSRSATPVRASLNRLSWVRTCVYLSCATPVKSKPARG